MAVQDGGSNGISRARIPDPKGTSRTVEGLVIGIVPAVLLMAFAIGTTLTSALAWFSLNSQISALTLEIRIRNPDRWTRSMMVEFCRDLEKENTQSNFKCPATNTIPIYRPPPVFDYMPLPNLP